MISARIQSALDKQSTRQGQQYYLQQAIPRWKERDLSVVHEQFVPLDDFQWFIVSKSVPLFDSMQQAALEQGLGVLQLRRKDTLNGLQIRGMDPKSIKNPSWAC